MDEATCLTAQLCQAKPSLQHGRVGLAMLGCLEGAAAAAVAVNTWRLQPQLGCWGMCNLARRHFLADCRCAIYVAGLGQDGAEIKAGEQPVEQAA